MIKKYLYGPKDSEQAVSPYERFDTEELILRDELAIDRTLLANERTLLSYLRSGVAMMITGLTIIHYATKAWFMWAGVSCIPFGIVTGIFGIWRFRKMQGAISRTLRWTHSA
jgi:putative membrane protein